jgi:anthranilate synthase component 2/para-aminobenzoate synthetase component 2
MILLVDNYDSFVHNVARYVVELGHAVTVRRNDAVTEQDVAAASGLIISPGPCAPAQAGQSNELIRRLTGKLPILGICLGHQCIGAVFGGRVVRAREPLHGEASDMFHDGSGVFAGLPAPFAAGRYHSLIVELDEEASPLRVTARSARGEIMGLAHRQHPVFGVQFHPESILTAHGYQLMGNFLERCR